MRARKTILAAGATVALALAGCGSTGQHSTTSSKSDAGATPVTNTQSQIGRLSPSQAVDMIVQAEPGYMSLFKSALVQYGGNIDQYRAGFDIGWTEVLQGLPSDVRALMPDPDAVFNELLNRSQ